MPDSSLNSADNANSYWAIVPAAGVGTRMQTEVPKQYLEIAGVSILEYTLLRLLSVQSIKGVVVCISRSDSQWEALEKSISLKYPELFSKIVTVHGGNERMHSVYNALTYLEKTQAITDEFVLVHDAVRPCVRTRDVEKLIAEVENDAVGGILATPLVDTLKRSNEEGRIQETVDRSNCWRAQTPQMFRFSILRKCIELQLNRERLATDEAAAIEASGFQALLVEGSQENIKLTVPSDLLLIEMFLSQQEQTD